MLCLVAVGRDVYPRMPADLASYTDGGVNISMTGKGNLKPSCPGGTQYWYLFSSRARAKFTYGKEDWHASVQARPPGRLSTSVQ